MLFPTHNWNARVMEDDIGRTCSVHGDKRKARKIETSIKT
jgi:hypothetical protein